MAVLASKVFDMTEGSSDVVIGVFYSNIVAIHRSGTQYDRVESSEINNGGTRQWCLRPVPTMRVRFPAALPANPGEKILVIYKPVV